MNVDQMGLSNNPYYASWERAEPMRRTHKNANRAKAWRRNLGGAFAAEKHADVIGN